MDEVARRAEVSKTIVSRVINNKKGVGEKTREKICRIIEELGYKKNELAFSLSVQKTDTIGIILNNLYSPFLFDMIKGLEDAGLKEGYNVLFCSGKNDIEIKSRYIDFFSRGRADGIIIYGSAFSDDALVASLHNSGYPLVLIENYFENMDVSSIVIDNYDGSYKAVEYLISLGHRKIAHIKGNIRTKAGINRLEGCVSSLKDNGVAIQDDWFVDASFSRSEGYRAMKQIFAATEYPTAVFCGSDEQAYGAAKAILERGLRIPEDISLMGFDDDVSFEADDEVYPKLTTMKQPMYRIGEEAAKLLIRKIKEPEIGNRRIYMYTEMVIRESCAPPKV